MIHIENKPSADEKKNAGRKTKIYEKNKTFSSI